MKIEQQTNILLRGRKSILQQYQGKENFGIWIEPLLDIFQELEDTFYALATINLDDSKWWITAQNLGIDRPPGWSNADYKCLIDSVCAIRQSCGKYSDIEKVFTSLMPNMDAFEVVSPRTGTINVFIDAEESEVAKISYIPYKQAAVLGVDIKIYYQTVPFFSFNGNSFKNASGWGAKWMKDFEL